MKFDYLKELGISLHLIATGGAAGFQNALWSKPGCSAYLSGASFPYAQEEHEEILGFKPEHYCSREDAVDLASAAYMKAFRFGGKEPVGLGITASLASEKIHHGDHHIFGCIITKDKVLSFTKVLNKGTGSAQRFIDGQIANNVGAILLNEAFNSMVLACEDSTTLATERFFMRPFFTATGRRESYFVSDSRFALMAGAFNPPHEGHFGMAGNFEKEDGGKVVFSITADTPHKASLSIQEMLKRAKLLQGRYRLFSKGDPFYLDKARRYPGTPIIVGADAALRMLDPKWGIDINDMLDEYDKLETVFLVANRMVDGELKTVEDVRNKLPINGSQRYIFLGLKGQWNISSTELRNQK